MKESVTEVVNEQWCEHVSCARSLLSCGCTCAHLRLNREEIVVISLPEHEHHRVDEARDVQQQLTPLVLSLDENARNGAVGDEVLGVVDVRHDRAAAFHKIADFVRRGRAIHVPVELVFDLFAQVLLPLSAGEVDLAQSALSVDFDREVLLLKRRVALTHEQEGSGGRGTSVSKNQGRA